MKTGLTIGRAAHAAGVGVETIRFYERRQLIDQPPKPLGSGVRLYSDDTVQRIRFIKEAQELGFSLREAKELLDLRTDPSADCAEVHEIATVKLAEVREKIRRLHAIDAALERLVATCPGCGDLEACSIMDALTLTTMNGEANFHQSSVARKDERASTMKSTTFTIDGLRCSACAEKVKQLVEKAPGVSAVSVSLDDRQARILYEPTTVTEDALAARIEKPGYRVVERR